MEGFGGGSIRGSPRGSGRGTPPVSPIPGGSGAPAQHSSDRPPIENPEMLANAWITSLSDMAVEAKNGTLTSQVLSNEMVAFKLQFAAMEKGPKSGQKRRNSASAVSPLKLGEKIQKDLNNNSPKTGYRLHSK